MIVIVGYYLSALSLRGWCPLLFVIDCIRYGSVFAFGIVCYLLLCVVCVVFRC